MLDKNEVIEIIKNQKEEIEKQINAYEERIRKSREYIDNANRRISEINAIENDSNRLFSPFESMPDNSQELKNLKEIVEKYGKYINDTQPKLPLLNKKAEELKQIAEYIEEKENRVAELENEIREKEGMIDQLGDRLNELENSIKEKEDMIGQPENRVNEIVNVDDKAIKEKLKQLEKMLPMDPMRVKIEINNML